MLWLVDQAKRRLRQGDVIGLGKTVAWAIRERYYEHHYGISSSAPVTNQELGTDSSVSVDYDPTSYLILRKIFSRLWHDSSQNYHTFLDAGCGKGRVLRVAASRPYRRIMGIELSPILVQSARQNLANIRGCIACSDIEVLEADAAMFEIPDHVGTVFMYNPFLGETMERFMTNLHRSVQRSPRDFSVVFVNPLFFDVNHYPWLSVSDEFKCFYSHYGTQGMRVVICRGYA